MLRKCTRVLSGAVFAALLCGVAALWAQPSLGSAQAFAVLGGQTVTNTNTPTVLAGELGVSPGSSVTGFPPGTATAIHLGDAVAAQAQVDVTTQYNLLAGAACTRDMTGIDLGGQILLPGVYCFSSSAQLTGPLTLNAQGNANAVFIFKIGSALTTASGSSVLMPNGGNPCGVGWQIGTSATLGSGTSFMGNLIALSSITLTSGASIIGRALARNAAVTLDNNNISFTACATGGGPPPVPTLATWAMIVLIGLLALAGFATLRKRQPLS